MSDSKPIDPLSKETAKELVDMIADVEREEAEQQEQTEAARQPDAPKD